ncbi:DUF350 domain-containing protein [Quadrisphaera sp. DSM 44207]|uniref:DUF350 domain-containing protein n=1 Tax=Quadrisphaera sp. DSM 44207 TaxID=1881057 RepID=UPI00089234DF|nr:DUF350 domain-containing protein [Quadrisphaera sp. DSM 44207]SDQ42542.1 protein of unknown function [Quadrisphaera sp. DSM 44207]
MIAAMLYAVAYTGVGVGLLALGFWVLDLLTPGRLGHHVWVDHRASASVVAAAGALGIGAIAFTTIWTNATSGFGAALLWTVAFGVLGVVLQSLAFLLLDLLTRARLGEVVTAERWNPACAVVAAFQVAVAAVIVASIA